MAKPTIQPDFNDHLSCPDYLDAWNEYFMLATKACLEFHGGHASNESGVPEFAAKIADQMMVQRLARISGTKDTLAAAKEAAKATPKKTAK